MGDGELRSVKKYDNLAGRTISQRFIDLAPHINVDNDDDLLIVIHFEKSPIHPDPHTVDAIFNSYEITGIRKLFENPEMCADAFAV